MPIEIQADLDVVAPLRSGCIKNENGEITKLRIGVRLGVRHEASAGESILPWQLLPDDTIWQAWRSVNGQQPESLGNCTVLRPSPSFGDNEVEQLRAALAADWGCGAGDIGDEPEMEQGDDPCSLRRFAAQRGLASQGLHAISHAAGVVRILLLDLSNNPLSAEGVVFVAPTQLVLGAAPLSLGAPVWNSQSRVVECRQDDDSGPVRWRCDSITLGAAPDPGLVDLWVTPTIGDDFARDIDQYAVTALHPLKLKERLGSVPSRCATAPENSTLGWTLSQIKSVPTSSGPDKQPEGLDDGTVLGRMRAWSWWAAVTAERVFRGFNGARFYRHDLIRRLKEYADDNGGAGEWSVRAAFEELLKEIKEIDEDRRKADVLDLLTLSSDLHWIERPLLLTAKGCLAVLLNERRRPENFSVDQGTLKAWYDQANPDVNQDVELEFLRRLEEENAKTHDNQRTCYRRWMEARFGEATDLSPTPTAAQVNAMIGAIWTRFAQVLTRRDKQVEGLYASIVDANLGGEEAGLPVSGVGLLVQRAPREQPANVYPWHLVSVGVPECRSPNTPANPEYINLGSVPVVARRGLSQSFGVTRVELEYKGLPIGIEESELADGSNSDADKPPPSPLRLRAIKGEDGPKRWHLAPLLRYGDKYGFLPFYVDACGGLPHEIAKNPQTPTTLTDAESLDVSSPASRARYVHFLRTVPVSDIQWKRVAVREGQIDENDSGILHVDTDGLPLRSKDPSAAWASIAGPSLDTLLLQSTGDGGLKGLPSIVDILLRPPAVPDEVYLAWMLAPLTDEPHVRDETYRRVREQLKASIDRRDQARAWLSANGELSDPAVVGIRVAVVSLGQSTPIEGQQVEVDWTSGTSPDTDAARKKPIRVTIAATDADVLDCQLRREQQASSNLSGHLHLSVPRGACVALRLEAVINHEEYKARFRPFTCGHAVPQVGENNLYLDPSYIAVEVATSQMPDARSLADAENAWSLDVDFSTRSVSGRWKETLDLSAPPWCYLGDFIVQRQEWQWRGVALPEAADLAAAWYPNSHQKLPLAHLGLPPESCYVEGERDRLQDNSSSPAPGLTPQGVWEAGVDVARAMAYLDPLRGNVAHPPPAGSAWSRRFFHDLLADDSRGVFRRYALGVRSRYERFFANRDSATVSTTDLLHSARVPVVDRARAWRRASLPAQTANPSAIDPPRILALVPLTGSADPSASVKAAGLMLLCEHRAYDIYGLGEHLEVERVTEDPAEVRQAYMDKRVLRQGPYSDVHPASAGAEPALLAPQQNALLPVRAPIGLTADTTDLEAVANVAAYALQPPADLPPESGFSVRFRRVVYAYDESSRGYTVVARSEPTEARNLPVWSTFDLNAPTDVKISRSKENSLWIDPNSFFALHPVETRNVVDNLPALGQYHYFLLVTRSVGGSVDLINQTGSPVAICTIERHGESYVARPIPWRSPKDKPPQLPNVDLAARVLEVRVQPYEWARRTQNGLTVASLFGEAAFPLPEFSRESEPPARRDVAAWIVRVSPAVTIPGSS